jgi:hypothetical protein
MKTMATIAAGAALATGLAGCALPRTDSHAHCAMKWADAYPGHPVCPDYGSASTTTQAPSELDREAQIFSPDDAAFLRDLHGVWNWDFHPDDAVKEAHAMCEFPQGKTATALPDIVRMIDPSYQGGDESFRTVELAMEFMKVAGQHFCPGH